MRPPFAERAKVATARSISPVSRTLTGFTSIPNEGAAVWMAPHWPMPEDMAGEAGTPRRRWPPCRSPFDHPDPFPAKPIFELEEAGGIAARCAQPRDEAGANRIGSI